MTQKRTNSLVNMVYENAKHSEPQEGMGATLLMWTDRYPYTIHKVEKNKKGEVKKLWASKDEFRRTDNGPVRTEAQEYEFFNNNHNRQDTWELFTLRKDGKWHQGTSIKNSVLAIGRRERYEDPTF